MARRAREASAAGAYPFCMLFNTRPSVWALLLVLGCHTHTPLPAPASAQLEHLAEAPGSLGTLVYRGRVQPRGPDSAALFSYERRVSASEAHATSTHLTQTVGGDTIVLHRAEHHPGDYRLYRFEEIHQQTGTAGTVTVDASGTATFALRDGRRRTERGSEPVVAGPTLFGFVLHRWDDLLGGAHVPVRFAAIDAMRTYRFSIRLLSQDAEQTRFEMRPSSPLVRLGVPTMHLTFDTPTRAIVRYEGLVPPLVGDRLDRLDARVDYTMQLPAYR